MRPHKTFRRDRRGSVALLTAAGLLAVAGLSGLALDGTRIWMVRSRLKTATDAAALVAARQFDQTARDADATAAFRANFDPSFRPGQAGKAVGSYLGAAASAPVVSQVGQTSVKVAASASVPVTLLRVLLPGPVTVSEASVAGRAGTGLELSLLIDTSMSMAAAGGGFPTKLAAAQDAIRNMMEILYGPNDRQPNLWVSVVPFSTAVNIGTQYPSWLAGSAPSYSGGFQWTGCVEARQGGQDVTEANPASAPFRRFYWPDTYKQNGTYDPLSATNSRCALTQAYAPDGSGTQWCMGDNDWGAPAAVRATNPMIQRFASRGASFSPNAWCPASRIQPLTASKAAVLGIVNGLATPFGLGTVIPVGLQAAWATLSENWQGFWENPNGTGGPALPTRYDTKNMQKAVVLLSDGDNNWYSARTMGALVAPENQRTELFYMSYGRLADARLPVTVSNTGNLPADYAATQPQADAALDAQTRSLCTAMKDRGIMIYVIGFEVASAANRKVLTDCASGPQHYFETPSASALHSAFTQIAGRLATPRLME